MPKRYSSVLAMVRGTMSRRFARKFERDTRAAPKYWWQQRWFGFRIDVWRFCIVLCIGGEDAYGDNYRLFYFVIGGSWRWRVGLGVYRVGVPDIVDGVHRGRVVFGFIHPWERCDDDV